MARKRGGKTITFVLPVARGGGYSFWSYTDKDGNTKRLVSSKDAEGKDKPWWIKFDAGKRAIYIPENQKDIYGTSVVEFVRNHPLCEGSENGYYAEQDGREIQTSIMFKELNDGKDAKIAMEYHKLVHKAEGIALDLKDADLAEVGMLLGLFSDDLDVLEFRVLQEAKRKPKEFLEVVEAPDRKARSLIRLGVMKGVLGKKGKMIVWEDSTLGSDEDDAVSTLLKNKKMLDAVEKNIKAVS